MRFDIAAHVYAHRGLWGGGVPENSLAAFRAAAAAGVGCELDVRPTRDGELVVFHDATLERMCGDARRLDALTLDELSELQLPDGSAIPTLAQCLAAMAGEPVLIELKVDAPGGDLGDAVADAIARLDAPCAVMSFDEATVARLRELVSDRPVGLLVDTQKMLRAEGVQRKMVRAKRIGCDYAGPHLTSLGTAKEAGTGLPLVTWTLRRESDLDVARHFGAAPIFEGFNPSLATGLAKSRGTPI